MMKPKPHWLPIETPEHVIAEETPLLPLVIAEAVCGEIQAPASLAQWLANKAECVYAVNPKFRAQLRRGGNKPRETLCAFMRHWLAAELIRTGTPRDAIPASWANGQPLTTKTP